MIPPEKIIIFTRYPVPGKTKTRLIPSLGPVRAANIHRKLAEKVFNNVKQFSKKQSKGFEVSYTGGSPAVMKAWLGKDIEFSRQCGGDLGKRMLNDFERSFSSGNSAVVLIGTDVPFIEDQHLEKAFYDLHDNDLVLGPSTDGGYWLIGMKQPHDLFKGITWGSAEVLDQTLNLTVKSKLKVSLLPPLRDVDTVDDLSELEPEGQWRNPYLSVIIPVFNEADVIERVINNVKNKDSEIIVVDGGSDDRTVLTALETGVTVMENKRNRALQQNRGASVSLGDTLLFLHADTHLPFDYPSIIFNTLLNKRPTIGAFKFKTDMKAGFMRFIEFAVNLRSRFLGLPYGDQCLFMSKSFFESAGGFPPVPIAEDLYFLKKNFKKASIKIAPGYAVTSARRWRTLGIFKTTLINILVLAGCFGGVSADKLYRLYQSK